MNTRIVIEVMIPQVDHEAHPDVDQERVAPVLGIFNNVDEHGEEDEDDGDTERKSVDILLESLAPIIFIYLST